MSVELFGFNIDTFSFEEAISKAKQLIDGNTVSQIITINPEMLEYAGKNQAFANIINEAEMLISNYISKIENNKNKNIKLNKQIEDKCKRLKIVSVFLGIMLLASFFIK